MPRKTDSNPNRSVMDLVRLSGLSDIPDKVLFVSDRTLDQMVNLSENEVWNYSRYATQFYDGGDYEPVQPDTSDSTAVDDLALNFQLEVVPVTIREPKGFTAAMTNANYTIPTATITTFPITTVDQFPTDVIVQSGLGWEVVRAGRFLITARATWAADTATGYRQLRIQRNGSLILYRTIVPQQASVSETTEASCTMYLNPGDLIEFKLYHTKGSNTTVIGSTGIVLATSYSMIGF